MIKLILSKDKLDLLIKLLHYFILVWLVSTSGIRIDIFVFLWICFILIEDMDKDNKLLLIMTIIS